MSDDRNLPGAQRFVNNENSEPNKVVEPPQESNEKSEGDEVIPKGPPKLAESQKEYHLTQMLIHGSLHPAMTGNVPCSLGRTFTVWRDENGIPIILEIFSGNTAAIKQVHEVASALRSKVETFLCGPASRFNVTYRKCVEIVTAWMNIAPGLKDYPVPISFNDEDILAFARHPFGQIDPKSFSFEEKCPIIFKSLTRMTNKDAFCCRVGSIFDRNADRKQMIWLYGPGDGGKTFFQDLLSFIVGGEKACVNISQADTKSQFWKEALIDKHIVFARDIKNKFLLSDDFKTLTGENKHSVNRKGKPFCSIDFRFLMFCASNDAPSIPNDSGLINRIIDCEVQPIPVEDRLDSVVLWEKVSPEIPYFISYCRHLYSKLNSRRIPVDHTNLEAGIGEYNSFNEAIFDKLFIKSEDSFITNTVFQDRVTPVLGSFNGRGYREFKKYVTDNCGVKWETSGPRASRFRILRGLQTRNIPLSPEF